MTFEDCISRFEELSAGMRPDNIADGSHIQFKIIGNDGGYFYLAAEEGQLKLYNGECKERDVMLIFTSATLEKVMDGAVDPIYAYATGKYNMLGDTSLGRTLLNDIIAYK